MAGHQLLVLWSPHQGADLEFQESELAMIFFEQITCDLVSVLLI